METIDTGSFSVMAYTPKAIAANETLFTTANGTLGLRGDFEEKQGSVHKGTYINGFFDSEPIIYGEKAYGYAEHHETILNLPDPKRIELELNGQPFSVETGDVSDFLMTLDFKTGIMTRSLVWTAPDGTCAEVKSRRLVSFCHETGAAIEYSVRLLNHASRVRITSAIDTDVHNINAEEDPRVGSKFSSVPLILQDIRAAGDVLSFAATTRNSRRCIAGTVVHEIEFNTDHDAVPEATSGITESAVDQNSGLAYCKWIYNAACGDTITVRKFISYEADIMPEESAEESVSALAYLSERTSTDAQALRARGFAALCEEQHQFLAEFWDIATISIEGDAASEQSLHFNLFHLLQSIGRNGKTSIAAKGLTAEGYEGHYFWDTEVYVCPVFTYLAPDIAHKLLEYRYSILPAARRRATVMSLQGALFPWRTIDGEETSAYYPAGTAQYHINADIMFAFKKFLNAAGQDSFDSAHLLEMGIETARMWMSLGSFIPSKDNAFCINTVTGPDEYTACVNNNTYTNLMARENLRFSIALVKKYGNGENLKSVRDKSERPFLPVSAEELAGWEKASDAMYIPFDPNLGIYPQDDSFLDKVEWDFANTPPENYPLLLHYHPLVIYRHRVLKQPDLVLAQFLLSGQFSRAEKIRNFLFYEPLTTGDSSLSHCIQSVMACEVGDVEKAEFYFNKTARMDIEDIHGNTRDGIHTAAMAGSWMSVVYGFAGFRDYEGKWRFNPQLPEKWHRLSFSLKIGDAVLDVSSTHESVTYSLRSGESLSILHRNEHVSLSAGRPCTFSLLPRLRAVLFDLDGVITDTAELHYQAWNHIATQAGLAFDRTVNEKLRGVSRSESFDIILAHNKKDMSVKDKEKLIGEKNAWYVLLLENLTPDDVLPGIRVLLPQLRQQGIKTVLASASRNAGFVCHRLEIESFFDAIVDVSSVQKAKPEPDIFLRGAELADAWPGDCIGIEDAQAGVDAIKKAGMKAIGVGMDLSGADRNVPCVDEISYELLVSLF